MLPSLLKYVGLFTTIIGQMACVSEPAAPEDELQVEWSVIQYGQSTDVSIAVVRPPGYTDTGNHPVVLALPWGGGTADLVLGMVATYWSVEPRARGYIVISPEILGSSLETEAAEFLPALFDWMDQNLSYDANRVVLAGASNGGRGIFFATVAAPDKFRALIGMPGAFVGDGTDLAHLGGRPVWLMVGEQDTPWRSTAESTKSLLESQGAVVTLDVLAGQGHVLDIPQATLMDWIDDALK